MGCLEDSHQWCVAVFNPPQDRVIDAFPGLDEWEQLPRHPGLHVDGVRQAEVLRCREVDVRRDVRITVGVLLAEDGALMRRNLRLVKRYFEKKLC